MICQYLNILINRWNGDVIVMGFNEVRHKDERYGSIFNARGVDAFNSFILAGGLVEVLSGGYSFTWSHKSASKMSKLDHFLVSDNLQRTCPNLSSLTLDRFLSDHRPILLRELNIDYGPTPFRFFHNWFELEGLDDWIPPHVKTSCLNMAAKDSLEDVLDDDDEEVEEVYIEDNGRHVNQNKGANTPSNQVQDV
ncbi:RNA-directed DNA polymerase, eukaryota [Tanacetum coccineum]